MARTFIRQDTQIRRSDVYTDNTAPTEAAYETNPVNIEDDLNNTRSMLNYLLALQAGNWWDPIPAPTTFEGGTARAVTNLNQDLHDLERKRVLVDAYNLTDITIPACGVATGVLTASALADTETVTIGATVYTMTSPFVDAAFNIDASGSLTQTLQNLHDAINLTGTPGSQYGTATTIHPDVTCTASDATTLTAEAKLDGTQGNLIVTDESSGTAAWAATTLLGGTGDAVVLLIGELPTNTTAAIGAVTTLGTVAAYNADFGNISLAEVGGTNAISPKNLANIEDTTTHDPILSGGRVVYALFQSESNTDGSTMTGTTPNRAMLSFVRINSGGTDLEFVPAADICGLEVHYSSRTRKGLEDLTEQDFLKGAVIDIPASVVVTRQVGYDNQGTTPVDVITHSYLDLEGAGLVWQIRDDLQAILFSITEGSAGGTSVIQIAADVDTFDVNAAVNDFLQGVTVDSGGTAIDIGATTPGTVSSGGTLVLQSTGADLDLVAGTLLTVTDQYQAGSTYATDLVLSDASAEWSLFETNFGEVSLLNAINQAYSHGSRGTKTYANCTSTTTADNDVGGSGGGTNLDAQLPDMSAGSFLLVYDVFLNGELLRPGADASANNDYYPGTSLALGQLKFEFPVKLNDVLCVIPYVT